MSRPSNLPTTVVTADTTLKSTSGRVWWISVSNSHATATAAIELSDGASPDRWACVLGDVDGASSQKDVIFDPPIQFNTDIRIDITGGTVVATVAFT